MDYQNRAGSKFGGGGVASHSATNADRRERLRKLALESIDLDKDPYIFRNHLGSFECRLCLTVHQNDGSYLAHTQGRKHQTNLARRAAREAKEGRDRENLNNGGFPPGMMAGGAAGMMMPPSAAGPGGASTMMMMGAGAGPGQGMMPIRRNTVKIGRPGYKITKIRDPLTRAVGLLFQLQYPEILTNNHSNDPSSNITTNNLASSSSSSSSSTTPRVRFMGAFEQKVEDPPDKAYQYLLIAAEPYETCAFKLQAREIDRREGRFWTWFDEDRKEFWVQILFKTEREERYSGVPGLGGAPLARR